MVQIRDGSGEAKSKLRSRQEGVQTGVLGTTRPRPRTATSSTSASARNRDVDVARRGTAAADLNDGANDSDRESCSARGAADGAKVRRCCTAGKARVRGEGLTRAAERLLRQRVTPAQRSSSSPPLPLAVRVVRDLEMAALLLLLGVLRRPRRMERRRRAATPPAQAHRRRRRRGGQGHQRRSGVALRL